MSGTILWITSIDRYISIVNHKYYKLRNFLGKKFCRHAKNLWATLDALVRTKHDINKFSKVCIATSAYTGTSLKAAAVLNVALLKLCPYNNHSTQSYRKQ